MKFKFGDIVINEYASENNPHRESIFVRYHTGGDMQFTDMKGNFWCTPKNNDKLSCIGSVIK